MVRKLWLMGIVLVLGLLFISEGESADEGSFGLVLGGTSKAPIKMEVFSDFECPACRTFYLDVVRQVLRDYSRRDKVCVIYYEFPLNIHKYSREAARYCEAAYRIGRDQALQVMDALFAQQADWKYDGNVEKTVEKALSPQDFKKLKSNMADPSIDKAIDQGIELANSRDVKGTPTMFIYYWGKMQKVENPHQLVYKYFKQDFLDKILK